MSSNYETEHINTLRGLLPECTVLLKNDREFRTGEPAEIALYGNGARRTFKGGTGSGDVNSRYFVTVEEGLENAGFTVTSKAWLDSYDAICTENRKQFVKKLKAQARKKFTPSIIFGMGKNAPEPEYELPLNARGEAAVYVLSRICGEFSDRQAVKGDLYLTDREVCDILALSRSFDKFVLILNTGGPVDLTPVCEVPNILILSQLGVDTGSVVADILLKKAYPSGKLSTTWSAAADYYPCHTGTDDTFYDEGIFVGYRYFSTFNKKAVFPFGFGLSFTDFKIENAGADLPGIPLRDDLLQAAQEAEGAEADALPDEDRSLEGAGGKPCCREGTKAVLRFKVTNTGNEAGREVVQVYVSAPDTELLPKSAISLAGYKKTGELKPGESEIVTVEVDMKDLASYLEEGEEGTWLLEEGDYIFLAGNSSASLRPAAAVRLNGSAAVKKVRSLLKSVNGSPAAVEKSKEELRKIAGGPEEPDKKDPADSACTDPGVYAAGRSCFEGAVRDISDIRGIPRAEISADTFSCDTVCYDTAPQIDPVVRKLSCDQLTDLSKGWIDPDAGALSIIGAAAQKVSGAAGETAHSAENEGIRSLIMADGPAGLRLSKDYYVDEKGAHEYGNSRMKEMSDIMGTPTAAAVKLIIPDPPEDREILHQYCTAIPIGTAIAQSWNTELAFVCGDIIGKEMELFGVDLWLAPAVNIHRTIMCGRNFEYYSEDPLLAGRTAAAVTMGVQSHPGRGVTIKHYAANNQETNRYNNNSVASERTIREIYLRAFEICIREASPYAVMTSYNLLNGEHTSQRRDLNEDILRAEFGFDGLVMSDWIVGSMMGKSSKYESPQAWKVALSGNDVLMPGSKKDLENLRRALADGRITRERLEINISRLARLSNRIQP